MADGVPDGGPLGAFAAFAAAAVGEGQLPTAARAAQLDVRDGAQTVRPWQRWWQRTPAYRLLPSPEVIPEPLR